MLEKKSINMLEIRLTFKVIRAKRFGGGKTVTVSIEKIEDIDRVIIRRQSKKDNQFNTQKNEK
jgi:hypothetical protein